MRKADYLLIIVMLIAAALGYGIFAMQGNSSNKILIIKHDNAIVERIPLKGITAETKLAINVQDGTLIVRYDKNGAWVEESPCPDKICIHQGKITKPGETVACVPEKVLLTIEEPQKEAEHDAVLK